MTDDAELWRQAQAGRADAFGELFQRHAQAVFGYCLRRTASWPAAEDLTSTVFLEAWRRRAETTPTGPSALPWLYGIALGVTRNHQRSLRRHHNALTRMTAELPAQDHADAIAEQTDAEQRARAVVRELAKLPRAEREVIEATCWMALTHSQAADLLGIPIGTVKSRLARAHHKLRSLTLAATAA